MANPVIIEAPPTIKEIKKNKKSFLLGNGDSPQNLLLGILYYRRNTMRIAYGLTGAYILPLAANMLREVIAFSGKVFSSQDDIFPLGNDNKTASEIKLRELIKKLRAGLREYLPGMKYASQLLHFYRCSADSILAVTDIENLDASQLSEALNALGKSMRSGAASLRGVVTAPPLTETMHGVFQVLLEIDIFAKAGNGMTSIQHALLYKDTACKNGEEALNVWNDLSSTASQRAEALLNGNPEPEVDIYLPHASPESVRQDVERYVAELKAKAAELPIRFVFLSIDYSLFNGLYVNATIFLQGNFSGPDVVVLDDLAQCWSRATNDKGYPAMGNAENKQFYDVADETVPYKFSNILFDLKCAAMKELFFTPNVAVGMQTFIAQSFATVNGADDEK